MKTVFYFTADWCNPCKKLKPIIRELDADGFAKFQYIDADTQIELVKEFNVSSVPTLILIEGGKESKRITGLQTRQALLDFIG